jgi:hypothetical protein
MWTLTELNDIDKSVRARYKGTRVLTEEKVGLSLKAPNDYPASHSPVRQLAFDVCGMHYTSPQYNIILLQDAVKKLAGTQLVTDIPTYSANHEQINFTLADGTKVTFNPTKVISREEFLLKFGVL